MPYLSTENPMSPLERALQSILDEVDGKADASCEPGDEREKPNDYMRIQAAADEALAEARKLQNVISDLRIPEGWKLVPIRPTEEMVEALVDGRWIVECSTDVRNGVVVTTNKEYREQRYVIDGWEDMLAAAPEAPK